MVNFIGSRQLTRVDPSIHSGISSSVKASMVNPSSNAITLNLERMETNPFLAMKLHLCTSYVLVFMGKTYGHSEHGMRDTRWMEQWMRRKETS